MCCLQAVALPQLRESPAHQAVIPDQIDRPPALLELPLRWEPGPSFEEALASARGPEKAAADLLPLDATFDPETHEGAGKPVTPSMIMLLLADDKVCALQSQAQLTLLMCRCTMLKHSHAYTNVLAHMLTQTCVTAAWAVMSGLEHCPLVCMLTARRVRAALSTHAGRNQRALPDKRARRKPGWLDNTIDSKTAAQMALHQATGVDVRSAATACTLLGLGLTIGTDGY